MALRVDLQGSFRPLFPRFSRLLGLFGLTLSLWAFQRSESFPEATISNGLITAKLYVPDAQRGYYRAERFDWSGVIADLQYQGHSFFGPWFDTHDPKVNDAIMGPVEEFVALGYEAAKPGETFLKIGVGALRKKDTTAYRFYHSYENTNPGHWTTRVGKDHIIFAHELTDAAGYSYHYEKTVRLLPNKPVLVLEHRLKNTGTKTIETNVYNHNFLVLDRQPTGPDCRVTFPFALQTQGETQGLGTLAAVEGNSWRFLKELEPGESTQVFLTGFGTTAKDYNLRVENKSVGVTVTGDQPLTRIVCWAKRTTFCPEPYIPIKAEPGKEFRWNIQYTFFTKE